MGSTYNTDVSVLASIMGEPVVEDSGAAVIIANDVGVDHLAHIFRRALVPSIVDAGWTNVTRGGILINDECQKCTFSGLRCRCA